jgi:hypothetical protein
MPLDVFRELRSLFNNLLYIVFAEAAVTVVVDLAYQRNWLRLAHCYNSDLLCSTAGNLSGAA